MSGDRPPRVTRRAALRTVGGVGVLGAAAGAAGAQSASLGDWFSDVPNFDGVVDRRGESEVTVEVGVDTSKGPYGFGPAAVRIDPGTTVTWQWVSNTHNIRPERTPTGWDGVADIHNQGFSYTHTFDTEGVYTYYCEPHRALGMKAAIVVGDVEVSVGGGGGGGGIEWSAPGGEFASTFLAVTGGLLALSAGAVLAGGALHARREERAARETVSGEVTHTEEATPAAAARELDHDEFDPVGTASLILVYVLILAGMWVFMYFVEFLGNGPTVMG